MARSNTSKAKKSGKISKIISNPLPSKETLADIKDALANETDALEFDTIEEMMKALS